MFKVKEAVRLEPRENASRRTKNRIKQYGPIFEFVRLGNPQCFNGEGAISVRSFNGTWAGWFPRNEVDGVVVDWINKE